MLERMHTTGQREDVWTWQSTAPPPPPGMHPRLGSRIEVPMSALNEGTEPELLWGSGCTFLVSFPKLPAEETPSIPFHDGSSVCRGQRRQQRNYKVSTKMLKVA